MIENLVRAGDDLNRLLKLRTPPFGMKLFENRADMEAVPRIRRPTKIHMLDQLVAQSARLGWTIGVTAEDLAGSQCRAVVGLGRAKDAAWSSGVHMMDVWYATPEDAAALAIPGRVNGSKEVACTDRLRTVYAGWTTPEANAGSRQKPSKPSQPDIAPTNTSGIPSGIEPPKFSLPRITSSGTRPVPSRA